MSDTSAPSTTISVRTGTASDRTAKLSTTTAIALTGGVAFATADWLMSGHSAAGWYLSPPPSALVDMWVTAALPTIHLIAKIINRTLSHWAGEDQ